MSTCEFVDLDTLLRDDDRKIDMLHYIMAILYRPVDKKGRIAKYTQEGLKERAELFKEKMTCDYVLSAMLFSVALGQTCIEHTQVYSQPENNPKVTNLTTESKTM